MDCLPEQLVINRRLTINKNNLKLIICFIKLITYFEEKIELDQYFLI